MLVFCCVIEFLSLKALNKTGLALVFKGYLLVDYKLCFKAGFVFKSFGFW